MKNTGLCLAILIFCMACSPKTGLHSRNMQQPTQYDYVFNANGTLHIAAERPANPQPDRHISKYFYRYDTARQLITLVSLFYEQCADYPLKEISIYNKRGRKLEEKRWEVFYGTPDSLCHSFAKMKDYDVFDTTAYCKYQSLSRKHEFIYTAFNTLKAVKVTEYSIGTDYGVSPSRDFLDTGEPYKISPAKYYNHMQNFSCAEFFTIEKSYKLTVAPYLKTLR